MSLSAPALSLDSGPHGVQDARRWVVGAIDEVGRPDLVECAEMGVSELVTNALLHGAAPITVRVAGTREHPRVEVRDASTEPPVLPARAEEAPGPGSPDLSDLVDLVGLDDHGELGDLGDLGLPGLDGISGYDDLLTFGRGLSIVARASHAWGAEIEPDGKVVWFAPAPDFSEHDGPEGSITGVQVLSDTTTGPGAAGSDAVGLSLLGVPVGALGGFERYFRELRREVRLLALAHHEDYPMAQDLADIFGSLERPLQRAVAAEQQAAARHPGHPAVDVVVHLPRQQARDLGRFVDLLDLTDAFCREERLLALARTRGQRAFQNWVLLELVGQADGREPQRWSAPEASRATGPTWAVERRRSSAS